MDIESIRQNTVKWAITVSSVGAAATIVWVSLSYVFTTFHLIAITPVPFLLAIAYGSYIKFKTPQVCYIKGWVKMWAIISCGAMISVALPSYGLFLSTGTKIEIAANQQTVERHKSMLRHVDESEFEDLTTSIDSLNDDIASMREDVLRLNRDLSIAIMLNLVAFFIAVWQFVTGTLAYIDYNITPALLLEESGGAGNSDDGHMEL